MVALLLAMAWLLVPTVQYFATLQRTGLQLEGVAPYEALATWDLTPAYFVLLALTAVMALARLARGRAERGA